jgi:hypothetical protein
MPIGITICAALLVGAFFLRSSSISTGLSSQHLFLACCASLIGAFLYIWFSRDLKLSIVPFGFVLLTLPSLWMAEDPKTAATRWFGWFLVMAVVGPLFSNEIRLKLQVLDWTRKLLLVCAVGSLVLNVAGIRLSGRGYFFGLMGHSMILAPVSALAAIDLFCTQKQERSKWQLILLVICCVTCIGAGSRGAVMGLTIGILTHIAHRREGIIVVVLAAAALIGVSYVQAARSFEADKAGLGSGVYAELSHKGTNDTRGELWEYRIAEFRSSPVLGIGFQQQRLYREDSNEEFIEPGSGYLAVLSMTGTVGAIGFIGLLLRISSSLYTRNSCIPDRYKDLLRGWTAFFAFHLVIEGYIFACGSLLCFLFWLTIGCSISLHHLGRRKQLRDRTLARVSHGRLATAA